MVQTIIEHWEAAVALASSAFTVGVGWTLLKRDIKELKATVAASRTHIDTRFAEMAANCTARGAACKQIHDDIDTSIGRHGSDHELHLTDHERNLIAEWREQVIKRFDRLETILMTGRPPATIKQEKEG